MLARHAEFGDRVKMDFAGPTGVACVGFFAAASLVQHLLCKGRQSSVGRVRPAHRFDHANRTIDVAARGMRLGLPLLVVPEGFGVQGQQLLKLIEAARREQRTQAGRGCLAERMDASSPPPVPI
jgi:hypothetical protein